MVVAGQVLDVEGKCSNEDEVKLLHSLKTGAMICAATELGCIAAGGDDSVRLKAVEYGRHIGLAFQVRDDMLDVVGDEQEFGKPIGSDKEEGKITFVDLRGLEGCSHLVEECTIQAKAAVAQWEDHEFLWQLADKMVGRTK